MADWLFSNENSSRVHDFGAQERVDFHGGPVNAYLEESPVLPGIWLYRGESNGSTPLSIEVEGDMPRQGRIILGTILASRGVVSLEGLDDQVWRDDGRFYVITPVKRRTRYDILPGPGWRTVALRLETEALDMLGADGSLPELARQALEGRRDDVSDMAPLPGAVRSLAHMLLRSPYEGRMQTLYRQAKVLELLAHQFAAFGDGGDAASLNATDLAKVRLARERLLADLREPPDLETLARDVGLSPKRLNRGFRELHGTTVFNYLRDARLDSARAALEAGTPLPLKQLAWELGYGQVSNFVTAFRRRFGVAPGAYRGRMEG